MSVENRLIEMCFCVGAGADEDDRYYALRSTCGRVLRQSASWVAIS
jgi:hypothetical protein